MSFETENDETQNILVSSIFELSEEFQKVNRVVAWYRKRVHGVYHGLQGIS